MSQQFLGRRLASESMETLASSWRTEGIPLWILLNFIAIVTGSLLWPVSDLVIWPSIAICATALLVTRKGHRLGVGAALALSNICGVLLAEGSASAEILPLATLNIVEAALCAVGAKVHLLGKSETASAVHWRKLPTFIATTVLPITSVAAVIGSRLITEDFGEKFIDLWARWFVGDTLMLGLGVPLLLSAYLTIGNHKKTSRTWMPRKLRTRLVVLLATALLPLLTLDISELISSRQTAKTSAQTSAYNIARIISIRYHDVSREMLGVMHTISALQENPSWDGPQCHEFLDQLNQRTSWSTSFSISTPQGRVWCWSRPDPVNLAPNLSDTAYFQTAMANGTLSVSDLTTGKISGEPAVVMALPTKNKDGTPNGVITAGLSLEWFNEFAVEVMDRDKPIRARIIDNSGKTWHIKKEESEKLFQEADPALINALAGDSKMFDIVEADRDHLIGAYQSLEPIGKILVAYNGNEVLASSDKLFYQSILALVAIMFLAAIAIWTMTDTLVIRGLSALANIAEKVARGERPEPVNLGDASQEVEALGQALYSMAEKVSTREAELARARHDAEAANRAKSSFLATVSHEIRTPLVALIGYAQLLKEGAEPSQVRKYAQYQAQAGETLLALINDILDQSRIEARQMPIEKRVFNPVDLARSSILLFENAAERKGLKLHFECTVPPELDVFGDDRRVRQVLLNLIGNAIKFTESGSVTLRLFATEQDLYRFELEDTGIGIHPDRRNQLFERFHQVHQNNTASFGGTGLGLAISKQLIELMGGRIDVVTDRPQGTLFWFELPLPASDTKDTDIVSATSSRGSMHIVIAEDVDMARELLTAVLTRSGHTITGVANGVEAVEAARNGCDLILMDIQMPVMDGMEAIRTIRSDASAIRNIPILGLTANLSAEYHERCLAAGMNEVLGKPIDHGSLIEAVNRLVKGFTVKGAGLTEPPNLEEPGRVAASSGSSVLDEMCRELETPDFVRLIESARTDMARYTDQIRSEPWDEVARASHSLITLAGNLGMTELSAAARKLEDTIQTNDQTQAGDLRNQVVSMAEQSLRMLNTYRVEAV